MKDFGKGKQNRNPSISQVDNSLGVNSSLFMQPSVNNNSVICFDSKKSKRLSPSDTMTQQLNLSTLVINGVNNSSILSDCRDLTEGNITIPSQCLPRRRFVKGSNASADITDS